jgi:hypothetical protein
MASDGPGAEDAFAACAPVITCPQATAEIATAAVATVGHAAACAPVISGRARRPPRWQRTLLLASWWLAGWLVAPFSSSRGRKRGDGTIA